MASFVTNEGFVHSSLPNTSATTSGIKGTRFPYVRAPHAQNPHNPGLSRFEIFQHAETFCGKREPLYAIQYSELFVTYTIGFNMHTGLPNPHSVINGYFSDKLVLDPHEIPYVFPAINAFNNFASKNYDTLELFHHVLSIPNVQRDLATRQYLI